jgi:hypothetical protein
MLEGLLQISKLSKQDYFSQLITANDLVGTATLVKMNRCPITYELCGMD